MSKYIKDLIYEGEGLHLDFKYAINDSRKIARSLVAFANTEGGKLLIGVKDNGSIVGVSSDEEFYMVQAAAQLYCRPEIIFTTKPWNVDGKTVLEIIVPQSTQKPHFAEKDGKWWAYIRVEDENQLANVVMLNVWKKGKRAEGLRMSFSEQELALFRYLQENEYITLSKFMRLCLIRRSEAIDILSSLVVLKVLEVVFKNNEVYYKQCDENYVLNGQIRNWLRS